MFSEVRVDRAIASELPMNKTIAIIQSNYIPWKGYFDIINSVDEFILYDEVQYTRSDWRNRNKVICQGRPAWLVIPVSTRNHFETPISAVAVADDKWHAKHLKTLAHNYRRAPCFSEIFPILEDAYVRAAQCRGLSEVNEFFIRMVCGVLKINTPIVFSSMYQVDPGLAKSERLLALCQASGATTYLSGPAARAYLDESLFKAHGVEVRYMSYDGYPAYRQLSEKFEHGVSIVDLLLNEGRDARHFMKSFA